MKICLILGTRPEIIKLAPLIRILSERRFNYFILHTGQHYSVLMNDVFFSELKIPSPKYNLQVGSGSHAEETGRMMIGIENILKQESPRIVLVQGDTNTTLAGALATSKLRILLGHVESGLRSFDRRMPEELNRVVVDHLSDKLFAPTDLSGRNLRKEGIESNSVFVTGNTIVDALRLYWQSISAATIDNLTKNEPYLLCTLHREENVDNPLALKKITKGLGLIYNKVGTKIILPLHPRTRKRIKSFNIRLQKGIELTEPLSYFPFVKLESKAELILTDSGGVQEEACVLHVPCVTLRMNTERPETLEVGANAIAGTEPDKMLNKALMMIERKRNWSNPFGDGRASERIMEVLDAVHEGKQKKSRSHKK